MKVIQIKRNKRINLIFGTSKYKVRLLLFYHLGIYSDSFPKMTWQPTENALYSPLWPKLFTQNSTRKSSEQIQLWVMLRGSKVRLSSTKFRFDWRPVWLNPYFMKREKQKSDKSDTRLASRLCRLLAKRRPLSGKMPSNFSQKVVQFQQKRRPLSAKRSSHFNQNVVHFQLKHGLISVKTPSNFNQMVVHF